MTNDHPILLVDDDQVILDLVARVLKKAGYGSVMTAGTVEAARHLLGNETVDVVLTDMQMPGGSGLDLLRHLHQEMPGIATLMVTGVDDPILADEALALGAYGFIIKPFRASEVVIGVSNALRRQALERENENYRDHLEETVKLRTADLWDTIVKLEQSEKSVLGSRAETIERLAIAGEFHDEETGFHVARMSRYCEALARRCGPEELHGTIREASSLHDVGKLGIPDPILLKPGALSAEERATMQEHAEIGYRILKSSQAPILKLAAEIALVHHEWFDGTGYPRGLAGDAIPLAGRIAAVADVFDALSMDRVYRRALELVDVVETMKSETGTHFDPDVLSEFWEILPEILAIAHEYGPKGRGSNDDISADLAESPLTASVPVVGSK